MDDTDFFRRAQPIVRGVVRSHRYAGDDADDVIQTANTMMLERLRAGRIPDALDNNEQEWARWVRSVAHQAISNTQAERERRPARVDAPNWDLLIDNSYSVEGEVLAGLLLDAAPRATLDTWGVDMTTVGGVCDICLGPLHVANGAWLGHKCPGDWRQRAGALAPVDPAKRLDVWRYGHACVVVGCNAVLPRGNAYCPQHRRGRHARTPGTLHYQTGRPSYQYRRHPCAWCSVHEAPSINPYCGRDCAQLAAEARRRQQFLELPMNWLKEG